MLLFSSILGQTSFVFKIMVGFVYISPDGEQQGVSCIILIGGIGCLPHSSVVVKVGFSSSGSLSEYYWGQDCLSSVDQKERFLISMHQTEQCKWCQLVFHLPARWQRYHKRYNMKKYPGQSVRRCTVISIRYLHVQQNSDKIHFSCWGYLPALSTFPKCHYKYNVWRAWGTPNL